MNLPNMNIPKNLEEAVELLYQEILQAEMTHSKDEKEFSGQHHMGIGRNIRNNWALWYNDEGNTLTDYFRSIDINHGDDRSGIINTALHARITGTEFDLEKEIARYKNHWLKCDFPEGIHPPIFRDDK